MILVTGNGSAGSWRIRGDQLGEAIGAEVMPNAEMVEIRNADLVVVVKRTPEELIRKLRKAKRFWVWDIVDGWPQPYGNGWSECAAKGWLQDALAFLRPNAVVFPTTRMLEDSGWKGPALVLPHHAWPKYSPAVVREQIERVGYEGDVRYLGRWHDAVREECDRRGWEFQLGDLTGCDVGICLRDVSGYPAGAWKANTKLANCQALGIPAVCSPEASYMEFGSGGEWFVSEPDQLTRAFNELGSYELRHALSGVMLPPTLANVAEQYRQWLDALR